MIRVVFWRSESGRTPISDWLADLKTRDRAAYADCVRAIKLLRHCGHELRRPDAAQLSDQIYELRVTCRSVQYRLLYFFHGAGDAVIACTLKKKTQKVPSTEIRRAVERREAFRESPARHTEEWEVQ